MNTTTRPAPPTAADMISSPNGTAAAERIAELEDRALVLLGDNAELKAQIANLREANGRARAENRRLGGGLVRTRKDAAYLGRALAAAEREIAKLRAASSPRTAGLADPSDTTPLEDLGLTVRSYNCLKREGIHTVGELAGHTADSILDIRNIGVGSLADIQAKLAERGLRLADACGSGPR